MQSENCWALPPTGRRLCKLYVGVYVGVCICEATSIIFSYSLASTALLYTFDLLWAAPTYRSRRLVCASTSYPIIILAHFTDRLRVKTPTESIIRNNIIKACVCNFRIIRVFYNFITYYIIIMCNINFFFLSEFCYKLYD